MPGVVQRDLEPLRLQMVEAFEQVRDMPYYVSVRGEQDFSCVTKSQILRERLTALGVESRFVTCSFEWSGLGLPAPLDRLPGGDTAYHQFLEVRLPGTDTWVDADPGWDSGLSKILPVAQWDGRSSAACAVKPTRRWYEPEDDYLVDAREVKLSRETVKFLEKFNSYLAEERKKALAE